MSKIVRVALDLDVETGSAEDVSKALFEHREAIANFATHVVLTNDATTSGKVKVTPMAGSTHVHPDPQETGERCPECLRYSGKALLTLF